MTKFKIALRIAKKIILVKATTQDELYLVVGHLTVNDLMPINKGEIDELISWFLEYTDYCGSIKRRCKDANKN